MARAAEMKISAYPNITGATSNLLFLMAEAGVTNFNISFGSMTNQMWSQILGGTNYGGMSFHSPTNTGLAIMGEGTNYVLRILASDGSDTNKALIVAGPTNTVAVVSTNHAVFYMQVIQQVKQPVAGADYAMLLTDHTVLAFGTNQLITLPSALIAPVGWTATVSSTNVDGSFVITNATGAQTIRTTWELSYTNTGIGSATFINSGGAWWMIGKSN